MRVHFIAIGGAIMHQLAIALHLKGDNVSGSDDMIKDPSKSNLEKYNLLPSSIGFDENNIDENLDFVILGMHAKSDNVELIRAKELNIPIYSFPEFVYRHSVDKKRIVIAGSHGKTSITSMVMHVLKSSEVNFDYVVGSSVDGFEHSVKLTDTAPIIVIEGDEYLTSTLDLEPKFIHYHAHIATISGIEWDHINVFPTLENYQSQFKKLIKSMESEGTCFYFDTDTIRNTISNIRKDIELVPYRAIEHRVHDGVFYLVNENEETPISLFGEHNMQNLEVTRLICSELGINKEKFIYAIADFQGAGRRLETIIETPELTIYRDFAHSPSKLNATLNALRQKYPENNIIACYELHTFSTLNRDFLPHYQNSLAKSDFPIVYLDKIIVEKKGSTLYSEEEIRNFFGDNRILLVTNSDDLAVEIQKAYKSGSVIAMMSSGNFGGLDIESLIPLLRTT